MLLPWRLRDGRRRREWPGAAQQLHKLHTRATGLTARCEPPGPLPVPRRYPRTPGAAPASPETREGHVCRRLHREPDAHPMAAQEYAPSNHRARTRQRMPGPARLDELRAGQEEPNVLARDASYRLVRTSDFDCGPAAPTGRAAEPQLVPRHITAPAIDQRLQVRVAAVPAPIAQYGQPQMFGREHCPRRWKRPEVRPPPRVSLRHRSTELNVGAQRFLPAS
jgi:hypothetical protein